MNLSASDNVFPFSLVDGRTSGGPTGYARCATDHLGRIRSYVGLTIGATRSGTTAAWARIYSASNSHAILRKFETADSLSFLLCPEREPFRFRKANSSPPRAATSKGTSAADAPSSLSESAVTLKKIASRIASSFKANCETWFSSSLLSIFQASSLFATVYPSVRYSNASIRDRAPASRRSATRARRPADP